MKKTKPKSTRVTKVAKEVKQVFRKKNTKEEIFAQMYERAKDKKDLSGLAEKLNVAPRTLRSYYKYFTGEKLGKYDRKPPETFIQKNLLREAKKEKINTNIIDSTQIKRTEYANLNKKTYKSINKEKNAKGYHVVIKNTFKQKGKKPVVKFSSFVTRDKKEIQERIDELTDIYNEYNTEYMTIDTITVRVLK